MYNALNSRLGIAALGLTLTTGCFTEVSASNGELGRLTYSFVLDFDPQQDELTAFPLMTRYDHRILTDLTSAGERRLDDPDELFHTSDGATIQSDGDLFTIRTEQPGPVRIESMVDGELFDTIELQFADPTGLELVTWVRAPWEDEWVAAPGLEPLDVVTGTQISFLTIPVADDTRLGGSFVPEVTVESPDLVVPDRQVLAVQEGGITDFDTITYYAVGEGSTSFRMSEPNHGVSVGRDVRIR